MFFGLLTSNLNMCIHMYKWVYLYVWPQVSKFWVNHYTESVLTDCLIKLIVFFHLAYNVRSIIKNECILGGCCRSVG